MTVRKILRPSATIPGTLQPVFIDAEAGGKKLREMDVDGGAIARLFPDPRSVDISTGSVHVLAVHGRRI